MEVQTCRHKLFITKNNVFKLHVMRICMNITCTPIDYFVKDFSTEGALPYWRTCLNKWYTVFGFLIKCFVEQDYTADILCHRSVCGEQQLPVTSPVFFIVLHSDTRKPLPYRSCRHVGRADIRHWTRSRTRKANDLDIQLTPSFWQMTFASMTTCALSSSLRLHCTHINSYVAALKTSAVWISVCM